MKAVIDLETGGFSITKNGICEIGILIVNDALEIVEEQSFLIKPYTRPDSEELVSYKEDAMAVNGIPMEEILNGMDVAKVTRQLTELLGYHKVDTLIGHNLRKFDLPRVAYLLDRFAGVSLDHLKIEDTLEMSRDCMALDSYKLGDICAHLEIVHQDSHRALGDCRATLELRKCLQPMFIPDFS